MPPISDLATLLASLRPELRPGRYAFVGLTAAFATALADAGIACNVIAGVHHDHLFVPAGRGDEALVALRELQRASSVVADGPRPGALS